MSEDFIKVINTVYALLDFFPDADPLKYKAKEKTLAVLESLTLFSEIQGWTSLKKEKICVQLADDITVLEKYLALAQHQGWITSVNFLILQKEFQKIKDVVRVSVHVRRGLESTPQKELEEPKKSRLLPSNQEFLISSGQSNRGSSTESGQIPKNITPKSKELSGRQAKILELLSLKGKVQVSDIIKEIPSITKRTIRRDLDTLLKSKVIDRTGKFNQVFYHKI